MQVTKSKIPTIPHPQLRGSAGAIQYPAYAEVKMDGEFNFLVYERGNGQCFLINKYGTVKKDFPALNDIAYILRENKIDTAMLICEVYWDEGKLGQLYDLLSHKKDDKCKICVFDLLSFNGDIRKSSLMDRIEALHSIGLAHITPRNHIVNNKQELQQFFEDTVNHGYEGVVVKNMNEPFPHGPCSWAKLKFKDQSDYRVATMDPVRERISVAVPLTNPALGHTQKFTDVGVKAPNRYKRNISLGDMVTIEHQGVLPSGSLRHPVLIKKSEWA